MPGDLDLDLRGRLIRSLGALREMLPGSFVERHRKCGKPNCRCADGKQLHSEFQVSVLLEGKLKTFHIPAGLAEEARRKVEMHQPDLLAEAGRLTAGAPQYHETTPQQYLQLWHLPEVDWPVADRVVRVVKTVRLQNAKRVKVEERPIEVPQIEEPKAENTEGRNSEGEKPKYSRVKTKQPAPIVSTNFYASNVDLGAIPPYFIHQLGRSRWTIDTQAFQTITTDCHLKQPSAHQDCALIVLTMIRVLACTLTMVFYYRQVRSHCRGVPPGFCDMARQLAYGFLTGCSDTS